MSPSEMYYIKCLLENLSFCNIGEIINGIQNDERVYTVQNCQTPDTHGEMSAWFTVMKFLHIIVILFLHWCKKVSS